MAKMAAGLLLYRLRDGELQVLLAHPGGPLWAKKDQGVWTIPKGEPGEGEEDLLAVARREFEEETGITPCGPFTPLGQIRQKSGKVVHAWAFEGDCDPAQVRSNLFQMEWPPKSGQLREFPEVDRAGLFTIAEAKRKVRPDQIPLLDALVARVGGQPA